MASNKVTFLRHTTIGFKLDSKEYPPTTVDKDGNPVAHRLAFEEGETFTVPADETQLIEELVNDGLAVSA